MGVAARPRQWAVVDQMGKEGELGPWPVAGVAGATKGHTLVRLPEVGSGSLNWTSSSVSEWAVLGLDVVWDGSADLPQGDEGSDTGAQQNFELKNGGRAL